MFSSILLGILLAVLAYAIWIQLFSVKEFADEIIFLKTKDNARIVLYHYKPEEENNTSKSTSPIILLCHGFMSNHHNFDIGEKKASLARWLRNQGCDVWSLDLRGRIFTKPGPFSFKKYNWSISHYVKYDAPLAIDYILAKTNAEKLCWFGHSMGGLIGYALASGPMSSKLNSVIAASSPSNFGKIQKMHKLSSFAYKYLKFNVLPLTLILKILSPVIALNRSYRWGFLANFANIKYKDKMILFANGLSNGSVQILRDFAFCVANQSPFKTQDKFIDFSRDFKNITLPILFIASEFDKLVPVESIKWGFENCSSKEKEFLHVAQSNNFSRKYGHIDLITSKPAEKEIYPEILKFLKKHGGSEEMKNKIFRLRKSTHTRKKNFFLRIVDKMRSKEN